MGSRKARLELKLHTLNHWAAIVRRLIDGRENVVNEYTLDAHKPKYTCSYWQDIVNYDRDRTP